MQAFDHRNYVPILWTKRGERGALKEMSPRARSISRPLFVVPPIDFDFEKDQPKKSVDSHLTTTAKDLVSSWGVGDAFIDMSYISDTSLVSGHHPLDWVSEQAARLGLTLTPVVTASSSSAYRAAARSAAVRSGDVCLRLPYSEWPSVAGVGALTGLLDDVARTPAQAHLVLDLEGNVDAAMAATAQAELASLPHVSIWRSLTIAGTGMPEVIPSGVGLKTIPRGEWAIHQKLIAASLPRVPTFGDYAVASTSPGPDVNPRFLNISAVLRYTVADDWLVVRGALFKGSMGRGIGGAAVPPAARLLVGHPLFLGAGHCASDDWLVAAASGRGPRGNGEIWRKWGTLHHLEFVTSQTAALP